MAEEPIENKQIKRLFLIELIMTKFNSKVVKNCIQVSMLTFNFAMHRMKSLYANQVGTFHIKTLLID